VASLLFNRIHAYSGKNGNTALCKPIAELLRRYTLGKDITVDPFARDCIIAKVTNDLNPNTKAKYHMQATDFLQMLIDNGTQADVIILDPPYSVRQISDLYKEIGLPITMQTTQNAPLYAKIKNLSRQLIKDGGCVINCGWNSMGIGKKHGFEMIEILMVCHGGAQNDTIVTVEQKRHLTPRAVDRFQREPAAVIPLQSSFIADESSATSSGN